MHQPSEPHGVIRLATLATLAVLALGACTDATTPLGPTEARASRSLSDGGAGIGGVFVTTNGAAGNAVVAFSRGARRLARPPLSAQRGE